VSVSAFSFDVRYNLIYVVHCMQTGRRRRSLIDELWRK
jgi:hypothetical protein